jgi:hypothetical protein
VEDRVVVVVVVEQVEGEELMVAVEDRVVVVVVVEQVEGEEAPALKKIIGQNNKSRVFTRLLLFIHKCSHVIHRGYTIWLI